MALKVLELEEKLKRNKERLEEKRTERSKIYHERNQLEDEIDAVNELTTEEEKAALEKKVDVFAEQLTRIEEEIEAIEKENEEIERQISEEQERSNAVVAGKNNTVITGAGQEERMYKGMENIILRSKDNLFNKSAFSAEDARLDLGKYIRGMVTGKWNDAEVEKRALMTSGASSLIPAPLYAKIVDKARNISIFTAANVPVVTMETNNLKIAKIKKDLVVAFKKEGEVAEESTPLELESIMLNAKTIYGYAYVSLEAIESAENLESILYNSFAAAVAEGIDKAMLYGVYTEGEYKDYAPSSILNNTDINVITAVDSNYDEIIKGIGKVKAANGTPDALAVNAITEETLSLLKDQSGQYITPPNAYTNIRKIISNQMEYSETDGSDLLVFDPNALLIGIQNNINIKVFDGDTECIKRGLVCFRVMAMIDCAVIQPKHICRIKGFGKAI